MRNSWCLLKFSILLTLIILGKPPKYRIKIWLQIRHTMKCGHPNRTYVTSQKVSVVYVIRKLLHCSSDASHLVHKMYVFWSFCSLLNICLVRLGPTVGQCNGSRSRGGPFAQPCTHRLRCRSGSAESASRLNGMCCYIPASRQDPSAFCHCSLLAPV